jgi:tyrosyl-tRNA synthetase
MTCRRAALRLAPAAASRLASSAATPRACALAARRAATPSLSSSSSLAFASSAIRCRGTKFPRAHASIARAADASSSSSSSSSSSVSYADRCVVDVLRERGLLDACTNEDELREAAGDGSLSVYCGFDPTADSLHLGNLLGIVVLAWFQRCGHTPIALLGGATGRVGDPSGKSAERPVLDDVTINVNVAGIEKILRGVLANSASFAPPGDELKPARVLNNLDWFGGMGFLEFLRDVGKYARVGTMMAKDSVKSRLESEQGMSFTEFSYQLLQGYDFVHLHREENVMVQVGGSDQWGNITAGTDLIRRISQRDGGAYGLTFPLLLKADGKKFGKSEDGAVWLSPDRLSPYKFYQHLLQSTDADVVRFMKTLTFVPIEEIEAMEAAMKEDGYAPNTGALVLYKSFSPIARFQHLIASPFN